MPPGREDESRLTPQRRGDLVLVGEEILALVLAEVGGHFLGPGDHGVALDVVLALPEEAEDVVGATDDGHGGRKDTGELRRELPNRRRIVGADQHVEQIVSELLLQVRRGTECVHLPFPLPPRLRES